MGLWAQALPATAAYNGYNKDMRTAPRRLAAVLLALSSAPLAAQPRVDANAGAVSGSPGSAAGASVTNNTMGPTAVGTSVMPMNTAPGLSAAPGAFTAPGAVVSPRANAPAALTPAGGVVAAPVTRRDAPVSPAAALTQTAPAPLSGVAPGTGRPATTAAGLATDPGVNPANSAAADASAAARGGPTARTALTGAAGKVSDARLAEASGVGDGVSVSAALDRVFDAASSAPALRTDGVAGKAQTVRGAIAQKVSIANTSSPADAPSLYLDAIKTAQDAAAQGALTTSVADGVAKVVRSFAGRKADASLGDLMTSAYRSAASGDKTETNRQLSAFDKWEALLGSSSRPLVSNLSALKSDVSGLLAKVASGSRATAPHSWFAKKDGSFVAVLPGAAAGIAAVPALAASFAISPAALAPQTALADAYRAYAADPRPSTGAGLIYGARRTLGASVPSAFLSASRFWLRTLLAAVWHKVVAFFGGAKTYSLSDKPGQDALRRDAASSASARAQAASAQRLLSGPRLTLSDARAAFSALGRAAVALRALSGEGDAAVAVEDLRVAFESAAAARGLRAADEVPSGLLALVDTPAAHWAARISDEASRLLDARFWGSRGGVDSVNLGAAQGTGVRAAALAKGLAGAPAAFVTLDERLWARGRGVNGEARLSADLRPTAAGGSVELSVDRGDAALGRRLEDLGFTVVPEGAGLRASITPEDFARDADELGLIAARALSAALGRAEVSAPADLKALAEEARRAPAESAALAAALDGREAFARAPVMGLVGAYEALAPTPVVVGGKPLIVSALRDPDTGLLSYARAAKPDGAALGAVEIRALLRAR